MLKVSKQNAAALPHHAEHIQATLAHAAKTCGYSLFGLGRHYCAVPWTVDCTKPGEVAEAVRKAGVMLFGECEPALAEMKPHGRYYFQFILPRVQPKGVIDRLLLSVIPPQQKEPAND